MEQAQGCYLYCVADGGEEANLGRVGLEGREVYTIPYANISAVVHRLCENKSEKRRSECEARDHG